MRDPRKAAKKVATNNRAIVAHLRSPMESRPNVPTESHQQLSLPFQPSHQNQQSVGSTLASYALAGAGVAMGVTFVSVILGGF